MSAPLPLVELTGAPREQGRAHGEAARAAVAHNLAVYARRFAVEAGLSPADVRERGGRALAVIDAAAPEYGESLRGLAEGSGGDLLELAALNARYELLYSEFSRWAMEQAGRGARGTSTAPPHGARGRPGPGGCTAFVALPEATPDGHLRLGQNWDWFPEVRGLLLRVTHPDGFRVLAFTEAGIVGGKLGLNTAGVGLAVNGLASDRDDWRRPGVPFHVRTWRALHARTLDEAVAAVLAGERACSANFLLAQAAGGGAGRAVDVETVPGAACRLVPRRGVLAHANHVADPAALGIREPLEATTSTFRRGWRMRALLEAHRGRLDAAALATILRDHDGYPDSVCAHPRPGQAPDERYATAFSAIIDLHAGELLAAAGNPCTVAYERFALAS